MHWVGETKKEEIKLEGCEFLQWWPKLKFFVSSGGRRKIPMHGMGWGQGGKMEDHP